MKEYYKNDESYISKSFNPGGSGLCDESFPDKKGHRFAFYAKGPNEGYAANKCALIHAGLSINEKNDELEWEYLVAEFYDINQVHRDDKQLISRPINLID